MTDQDANLPAPTPELHDDIVYSLVIDGDLSKLTDEQIVGYYYHRCELLGLDPGEKPFDLLELNGKKKLYTTKAGAAALTRVNQLGVKIVDKTFDHGMAIFTASARSPTGREVEDVGAVSIDGLRGESLANGIMKAATKAKRRAILAHCGLGLLDESELDGVRGAKRVSISQLQTGEAAKPKRGAGLTDSLYRRISEVAEAAGKPESEIRLTAFARCQVPAVNTDMGPCAPTIEQLSFPQKQAVREWLIRAAAKLEVRASAEPEIIDAESTEREPGDDRDIDSDPDVDDAWNADTEPDPPGAP